MRAVDEKLTINKFGPKHCSSAQTKILAEGIPPPPIPATEATLWWTVLCLSKAAGELRAVLLKLDSARTAVRNSLVLCMEMIIGYHLSLIPKLAQTAKSLKVVLQESL